MNDPKSEQFSGFGKAVIMRMLEQREGGWIDFNVDDPEAIAEYSAIVARAAYDIVFHALHFHEYSALYGTTTEEAVSVVPDMAELPEEEKHGE